jgi:hypothetical protein
MCAEDDETIPGDRLFLWFLAAGMPVSVNFIPFQVPSETSLVILTVSTVVSHLAETLSLVAGVPTKSDLAVPSQSSHRSRYTRQENNHDNAMLPMWRTSIRLETPITMLPTETVERSATEG